MKRLGIIAALSLCACTDHLTIAPPPLDGAASLTWLVEHDGAVSHAFAVEVGDAIPLPIEPTDQLTLLAYKNTLAELGLDRGEQTPAGSDAIRTRALRTTDQIFTRMLTEDGALTPWSPATTVSEAVLAFRIEEPTPEACAMGRGCYSEQARDLLGKRVCITPCPATKPVDQPAPPELPRLVCLSGWTAREVEGITICDPPDPPANCPSGQERLPSGICLPEQLGCPSDQDFIGSLPPGAITVRPGESISLALAMLGAGATATIAVFAGTYTEQLILYDGDLTILGQCAEETVVRNPGAIDFTVYAATARANLRDLTIDGGADAGMWVGGDVTLRLERVRVTSSRGQGARVTGRLEVERSQFEHTAKEAIVIFSGSAAIAHSTFLDAGGAAISTQAPATVDDVLIRGVSPFPMVTGYGIAIASTTATVTNAQIEDFFDAGVVVHGEHGSARVTDLQIRMPGTSTMAIGIALFDHANMTVERAFVETRAGVAGVHTFNPTHVVLRDIVVQPPREEPPEVRDSMITEGVADVERAQIGPSQDHCWLIIETVRANGVDLVLSSPPSRYSLAGSSPDAEIDIQRAALLNGDAVFDKTTRSWLQDMSLLAADRPEGAGGETRLLFSAAATATITRARLEFATGTLLNVHDHAVVHGEDLLLSDAYYNALELSAQGHFDGKRIRIERVRTDEITVGAQSSLVISHLTTAEGAEDSIASASILAGDQGRARISNFNLSGGKSWGVKVCGGSMVDLHQGEIHDRLRSIVTSDPDYDLRRLLDEVSTDSEVVKSSADCVRL